MLKKSFLAFVLALSFAFATAVYAETDSAADLQAQIDAVMAQVRQLQAQLNAQSGGGSGAGGGSGDNIQIQSGTTPVTTPRSYDAPAPSFCYNFNRYLAVGVGMREAEADALRTVLIKEGIVDNNFESGGFTDDVAAAVVQFQGKYGITQTGTVGPKTRAKLNSLYGCDIPHPTPTSAPVSVSVNGSPTLALTYDSNNSEAALTATFNVSVTAGASDLYLYTTAANVYFLDQNGKGAYSNSTKVTINVAAGEKTDAYGRNYTIISAGNTIPLTVVLTANPKQMFAGSYYATLNSLYTFGSDINNYKPLPVPKNQTNSKTIIGEVSPYISQVTPGTGVDNIATLTLTGVRFHATNNTITIGSQEIGGVASYSNGASIFIVPSKYSIGAGSYPLFVTNMDMGRGAGKSNVVWVQIGGGVSTSDAAVSASLVSANEDKVGSWGNFGPGAGYGNQNRNDWNWAATIISIHNGPPLTISRITLVHNTPGEVWSTGVSRYLKDGTDLYASVDPNRKQDHNPYPLVVIREGTQLNNSYDQTIFSGVGTMHLNLYGQAENSRFTGGKVVVEFSDGTSATAAIPASSIVQGQQGTVTIPSQSSITVSSSEIIGDKSSYTSGQAIKFSLKGTVSNGTIGGPAMGFNVQASMKASDPVYRFVPVQVNGVPQSFNATYNPSTALWDVTMTAPSDTSKTYTIDAQFYCSNSMAGCSNGQIDKSFSFTVTSFTVTAPVPSFVISNSSSNIGTVGAQVKLYTTGIPVANNNPQYFVEFNGVNDVPATVDSNGTFIFTVPNIASGIYSVAVSVYGANPNTYALVGGRVLSNSITFTITAPTISAQSTSQPSITVTSPNGGESLTYGDKLAVKWNYSGFGNTVARVNVYAVPQDGRSEFFVALNYVVSDNNNILIPIDKQSVTGTGQVIPTLFTPGSYKIHVACQNTNPVGFRDCGDTSDGMFTVTSSTISAQSVQPSIIITSPKGGEIFSTGANIAVYWDTNNVPDSAVLDIIRLRGMDGREYTLTEKTVNDGGQLVQIPSSVPAGNYTLEIKSYVNGVSLLGSSNVFSVSSPTVSPIPVPAPVVSLSASPSTVDYGGATQIYWTASNASSCVKSGGWSASGVPTSGNQQIGGLTATTIFTLTCTGPSGTDTKSVTVVVPGTVTAQSLPVSVTPVPPVAPTTPVTAPQPTVVQPPLVTVVPAPPDSLSFALVSTNEDKTGGRAFVPDGAPDWGFTATLSLGSQKTVNYMTISAGSETWTTQNSQYYGIAVFDGATQLNTDYGQSFSVPAGSKTLKLYAEKWNQTFNPAYQLKVVFVDGSSLSATVTQSVSSTESTIFQMASVLESMRVLLERLKNK